MPISVVAEPGVVTSVETADELKVAIVATPVVADIGEPSPIHVATPNQGLQGPAGPAGFANPFHETRTWALNGEIKVDIDGREYIPGFYVSSVSGTQTITLVDSINHIITGTSVVCKLKRNGVDIPGWINIGVDAIPGHFIGPPVQFSDGDYVSLVVTDAVGVPMNLTLSLVFEIVA